MTHADLQERLKRLGCYGGQIDGLWGPQSREGLRRALTNIHAPALRADDISNAAVQLGVSERHIRAVIEVEAPRGSFDSFGRVAMLYERHVFARNSGGRFNRSHPALSSATWQPGTYGPYSAQFDKLLDAVALDVDAAFSAVSYGMFQVLGENWKLCGYPSPWAMAWACTQSEADQMEAFTRFIEAKRLGPKLAACRAGNPQSCVPFVRAYNGPGYAANEYHMKLARAL